MSNKWDGILRQIRRHGAECRAEEDDSALLARFADGSDPGAFESLLRRYGSMVYRACRRSLSTDQDAEDAFQATFLALVRSAPAIRSGGSLAAWLHKTAVRVSGKIREQSRKRLSRELVCARPEGGARRPPDDELREILDEELDRLPDKYRRPVLLCRLLDRSLADVAAELGLSVATVWRRLTRAEELLRARLERRGLSVTSAVLAAAYGAGLAGGAPPAAVTACAARSAGALGAGRSAEVPARVLALLGGRGFTPWPLVVAVAVVLGGAVAAAVWRAPGAPKIEPPPLDRVRAPEGDAPQPAKVVAPEAVRGAVTGRVTDATGRPVRGARVAVLVRRWERNGAGLRDEVAARGEAGDDGRFQLPLPAFTVQIAQENVVVVLAAAPDGPARTVAAVTLTPDAAPAPVVLRLPTGTGVSGRVVDADGHPVAGAAVAVNRFGGAASDPAPDLGSGPPVDLWPHTVTTRPDGTFAIPGLDPAPGYRLAITHPAKGIQMVTAPAGAPGERATVALMPLSHLTGRVVDAGSGAELPGARVSVVVLVPNEPPFVRTVQAGPDGRFTVSAPTAARWAVRASPSESLEHLSVEVLVAPRAGREPVVLRLPRGRVLRGRVLDADGSPVPRAKVWYEPRGPVPADGSTVVVGIRSATIADADGRFELPAPLGPGTVLAIAPNQEFVPQELDAGELGGGRRSGLRVVAHASAAVKGGGPRAGDAPVPPPPRGGGGPGGTPGSGQAGEKVGAGAPAGAPETVLRVTRGRTIEGRAVRADGSPVAEGRFLCPHVVGGRDLQSLVPLPVRDGRFVIPGCVPGRTYTVQIVDPAAGQGAVAELRCPSPGAELPTVRLAGWGEVVVDVVTPAGRPVEGHRPTVLTIIPNGTSHQIGAPARWWNDEPAPATGSDGRVTLRGLVPGAAFRIRFARDEVAREAAFEPKPGTVTRLKVILPEPEN